MCIYRFHSSKQAALLTSQQTELSRLQCLARTNCPSPAHIGGALLLKIHIHCFCRGYSQSGQAAHELCVALDFTSVHPEQTGQLQLYPFSKSHITCRRWLGLNSTAGVVSCTGVMRRCPSVASTGLA